MGSRLHEKTNITLLSFLNFALQQSWKITKKCFTWLFTPKIVFIWFRAPKLAQIDMYIYNVDFWRKNWSKPSSIRSQYCQIKLYEWFSNTVLHLENREELSLAPKNGMSCTCLRWKNGANFSGILKKWAWHELLIMTFMTVSLSSIWRKNRRQH